MEIPFCCSNVWITDAPFCCHYLYCQSVKQMQTLSIFSRMLHVLLLSCFSNVKKTWLRCYHKVYDFFFLYVCPPIYKYYNLCFTEPFVFFVHRLCYSENDCWANYMMVLKFKFLLPICVFSYGWWYSRGIYCKSLVIFTPWSLGVLLSKNVVNFGRFFLDIYGRDQFTIITWWCWLDNTL